MFTNPNKFGLKGKKYGADQCIYVLKKIIDTYMVLNGSVFVCLLDDSKAFDHVNHGILFNKLLKRGIPCYSVRLRMCWYVNQIM